ncbi:MAG: hypothetical protein IT479_14750 [Xanthomonadales bacterium]|nr:hypothetical protein [Xanthomonadales bacterium]MCE7929774.1 hypothetical protein [Xanthomonadales bacterium PRO6]
MLVLLPWAVWYAGVLAREALVRAGKDPAAYDGRCERLNGLLVECSLERWLAWDTSPWSGMLMLGTAILAAAASAALWLWCLLPPRGRNSRPGD